MYLYQKLILHKPERQNSRKAPVPSPIIAAQEFFVLNQEKLVIHKKGTGSGKRKY